MMNLFFVMALGMYMQAAAYTIRGRDSDALASLGYLVLATIAVFGSQLTTS